MPSVLSSLPLLNLFPLLALPPTTAVRWALSGRGLCAAQNFKETRPKTALSERGCFLDDEKTLKSDDLPAELHPVKPEKLVAGWPIARRSSAEGPGVKCLSHHSWD